MRRIALINQKGGVGKTTTTVNLGAALARAGKRVVLIDLDPQANLTMHLDQAVDPDQPSIYTVLAGSTPLSAALQASSTERLRLVPSSLDLSGAELELANTFGREMLLRDAIDQWESEQIKRTGTTPADFVLIDCPPSLGLLSVNGLVAARETIVVVQTEFFALQGMSKLVEVVQLLRRRLNPELDITGILPCLYDNRLRLAREVLAEIRTYFPGQVFSRPISKNIKLAEAPSYGQTIFEYAPESVGAQDYTNCASELIHKLPAPIQTGHSGQTPPTGVQTSTEPDPTQLTPAQDAPTDVHAHEGTAASEPQLDNVTLTPQAPPEHTAPVPHAPSYPEHAEPSTGPVAPPTTTPGSGAVSGGTELD